MFLSRWCKGRGTSSWRRQCRASISLPTSSNSRYFSLNNNKCIFCEQHTTERERERQLSHHPSDVCVCMRVCVCGCVCVSACVYSVGGGWVGGCVCVYVLVHIRSFPTYLLASWLSEQRCKVIYSSGGLERGGGGKGRRNKVGGKRKKEGERRLSFSSLTPHPSHHPPTIPSLLTPRTTLQLTPHPLTSSHSPFSTWLLKTAAFGCSREHPDSSTS